MKKLFVALLLLCLNATADVSPWQQSDLVYNRNAFQNGTGARGNRGITSSGGTFSTEIISGENSANVVWDSSAASQTLQYATNSDVFNDIVGGPGIARFYVKCSATPCTYKLQLWDTGTASAIQEANVPTSTTKYTEVEVRGLVTSTTVARFISVAANEPEIRIKSGRFEKALTTVGLAGSNALDFTPVTQGFGTISAIDAKYWRVGQFMHIQAKWTNGTVTASEARITIPGGHSIAQLNETKIVGAAWSGNLINSSDDFTVIASSGLSYLTFGNHRTNTAFSPQTGSALFASSVPISINVVVPISGWDANVTMASDPAARPFVVTATGTPASTTAGNVYVLGTEVYDSHGAYDPSTGRMTAPIAGHYNVCLFTSISSTAAIVFRPYVDGVSVNHQLMQSGQAANYGEGGCQLVFVPRGGLLDVRPDGTTGTTNQATLSIHLVTGASTLGLDWPRTVIYLTGQAGYGSTGNKIIRWSNVRTNQPAGGAVFTADSTNGDYITITAAGGYCLSGAVSFNVAAGNASFGYSRSAASNTTAYTALSTFTEKITGAVINRLQNAPDQLSVCDHFNVGDIIRVHTSGAALSSSSDNEQFFKLAKMSH